MVTSSEDEVGAWNSEDKIRALLDETLEDKPEVDKKAHGNGIGTKLMQCVEDELQDQSQRILLVDTSGTADFERTRKFYDMLGYDREACIRGYYAEGDDKITFRKSLA